MHSTLGREKEAGQRPGPRKGLTAACDVREEIQIGRIVEKKQSWQIDRRSCYAFAKSKDSNPGLREYELHQKRKPVKSQSPVAYTPQCVLLGNPYPTCFEMHADRHVNLTGWRSFDSFVGRSLIVRSRTEGSAK